MNIDRLESDLDIFDRGARRKALAAIASALRDGTVKAAAPSGAVNVHLHTFFSFNANGWSPSRIAWEARKAGLEVAGTVDFDVLDALEEFFEAGDVLEIRTSAAVETRAFVPDYADREINSPGEPGVSYFMGAGFTALPREGSRAAAMLASMRRQARARNEDLLGRLAGPLAPLRIDYGRDVLPLTPSGNATERHMLAAIDVRARDLFPDPERLAEYWGKVLGLAAVDVAKVLGDPAKFRNTVRAKLMKRGGPGYVQPGRDTFPPIADVVAMVLDAGAIPCATWLDGTSKGEEDAGRLLDDALALGCLALNIIPDRNWNLPNPADKALKSRKLQEVVEAALERGIILSVGTEMNAPGQRFVDAFDAPEMAPHAAAFRDGALTLYGHTVLGRALGKGRTSPWAREAFGKDRAAANRFYLEVGRRAFPPRPARERLASLGEDAGPEEILRALP
jgi:hypothetical protein